MPSPISLIASSQLIRVHFPSTSFIGYFRRRSPWACSRTEAPLAQWAPRLNGLSQPGSCPTQTPLATSAMTVQPTEQWVQTDFMVSTLPSMAAAALALVTVPPTAPTAASPPMARPEPRRNARRSTDFSATCARAEPERALFATPLVFLLSIFLLPCDPPLVGSSRYYLRRLRLSRASRNQSSVGQNVRVRSEH